MQLSSESWALDARTSLGDSPLVFGSKSPKIAYGEMILVFSSVAVNE